MKIKGQRADRGDKLQQYSCADSINRAMLRRSLLPAARANKGLYILQLSVKSCPVGPELHPSFDASSPPGCCPQSHEVLFNKGIEY